MVMNHPSSNNKMLSILLTTENTVKKFNPLHIKSKKLMKKKLRTIQDKKFEPNFLTIIQFILIKIIIIT